MRENFDHVGSVSCKRHVLPSTNIIDLVQGCCQLAEILKVQLLCGVENITLQREINITGLDMKTLAEKTAEQVSFHFIFILYLFYLVSCIFISFIYIQLLMSPKLLMSGRQDVACSAVMGAAVAIGGQIFLPRSDSNITCCPHCSGEIKQI